MTSALYDGIARIARHEASSRAIAAVGRVVDIFTSEGAPADHAVGIELRDSGLVLPRVPIAVGVLGFAAIPAVDDLVVVVFLEGEIDAPVVVGRLYQSDHDPPSHTEGQLALRLPSGSGAPALELEVEGDPARVDLVLPGDVHLEIVEGATKVKVGELEVNLESEGGGRAEIVAGGSTITLKQSGDIEVKSQTKLVLEGTEVEIKGSASVKINGATVEIN